jgi:hypothetical protein
MSGGEGVKMILSLNLARLSPTGERERLEKRWRSKDVQGSFVCCVSLFEVVVV